MDGIGIVIIGHRSSKSTFGANNIPLLPWDSNIITFRFDLDWGAGHPRICPGAENGLMFWNRNQFL